MQAISKQEMKVQCSCNDMHRAASHSAVTTIMMNVVIQ